jgi:hypothetical protein
MHLLFLYSCLSSDFKRNKMKTFPWTLLIDFLGSYPLSKLPVFLELNSQRPDPAQYRAEGHRQVGTVYC